MKFWKCLFCLREKITEDEISMEICPECLRPMQIVSEKIIIGVVENVMPG